MPRHRDLSMQELNSIVTTRKAKVDLSEIQSRMQNGEKLVMEESLFSDPGEDYCRVLIGNQEVIYIPGY